MKQEVLGLSSILTRSQGMLPWKRGIPQSLGHLPAQGSRLVTWKFSVSSLGDVKSVDYPRPVFQLLGNAEGVASLQLILGVQPPGDFGECPLVFQEAIEGWLIFRKSWGPAGLLGSWGWGRESGPLDKV